MGVPSIRSTPLTCRMGPSGVPVSIESSFTQESPIGLGRNGDLVAKTPVLSYCLGEFPDKPYMAESLKTFQSISIAEFRIEHDDSLQLGNQPALTRNSEFGRKPRLYCCYRNYAPHAIIIFSVPYSDFSIPYRQRYGKKGIHL